VTPEDEQRRRSDHMPTPSQELIVYQLGELKVVVERGFERMDGRFDRIEERVISLERFRERIEERDRAAVTSQDDTMANLVKLALAAMTIVGTVLYLLANHGL
jgi:hypothetical protein